MLSGKRAEQLRAQGERTRERLVEVAREALAADGTVSLNAIARAANVGIGTLYRHFPAREDLVFELYRHEVDHLALTADDLLASAEPFAALRGWFDRYAQYVMTKAGLVQALRTASTHGQFAQVAYGPVSAAIGRLIEANERAGTIRAGYTADDVLLALDGLYNLDPHSEWAPRAERLFTLVADGLRPRT
ncbi:TetR/AcrR family transcriptional regulator [Lentzea sp. NPDC059081]|uniref:TetR/AcrR family transcriptional regulator n=1 Tax=Lentzea sp. NPDC059081 TaxID=3346719 RepID=UPI0036C78A06